MINPRDCERFGESAQASITDTQVAVCDQFTLAASEPRRGCYRAVRAARNRVVGRVRPPSMPRLLRCASVGRSELSIPALRRSGPGIRR